MDGADFQSLMVMSLLQSRWDYLYRGHDIKCIILDPSMIVYIIQEKIIFGEIIYLHLFGNKSLNF
jgi:hypothetical protein